MNVIAGFVIAVLGVTKLIKALRRGIVGFSGMQTQSERAVVSVQHDEHLNKAGLVEALGGCCEGGALTSQSTAVSHVLQCHDVDHPHLRV